MGPLVYTQQLAPPYEVIMMRTLSLLALILAASLASSPSLSKKPDFQGSNGNSHKYEHTLHQEESKSADALVSMLFGEEKKTQVRTYMKQAYGRHCPPGLAKKNNGCLPPGQAKKYQVGGFLPPGFGRPSSDLLNILGPAPAGAFYATVDKDVLLVSEATKKVLDAVTLLSAME